MDWHLAVTVFSVIFIAELPDKTAFAVLLMASQHNPIGVFVGTAGAFVVQSLVAVLLGAVLHRLPERPVHMLAGALFFFFAFLMWRKKVEEEEKEEERELGRQHDTAFWKGVSISFGVIFLAEWGDLTQLATATFVTKYHAPWVIFASSVAALWTVTACTVFVGLYAKKIIPQQIFQKIAAVAFALVGAILLSKG